MWFFKFVCVYIFREIGIFLNRRTMVVPRRADLLRLSSHIIHHHHICGQDRLVFSFNSILHPKNTEKERKKDFDLFTYSI